MQRPLSHKSTVQQIKARFDSDVARFANLETGQTTTIDAPLTMELITEAAFFATHPINQILDIGCGAGNNSIKLLEKVPTAQCDLVDLSQPMLTKAKERISAQFNGRLRTYQADFRHLQLESAAYDVILAAAVLHHLRDDADWETVFQKMFDLTAPGGSIWITDLVTQENSAVEKMMWQRYGRYLKAIGGAETKNKVFDYIDQEDSPRPVTYQLELLRKVGFTQVEILHKNATFAAFGAIKKK